MERLKAILKIRANGLKYNYEFLAIFIIIKDNKLVKLIKHVYQMDKCVTRIL